MHPGIWANVPPRVNRTMLEAALRCLLSRHELETPESQDMIYLVYFGDQSAVCVKHPKGRGPGFSIAIKANDSNMIVAVKLANQQHDQFLFPEPFNVIYVDDQDATLVGTYFY